ncbi:MAG: PAS domain S-box protein [Deltaproteobacteria bacterium]|nr:PAS domain S-box protein [Deltaproteobacteria bacterium]
MSAAPAHERRALWLSAVGGALGALALVGHALQLQVLYAFAPGRPAMQVGTAVFVVVAALGVALRREARASPARRAGSYATAAAVFAFGVVVGLEYLLHLDLGVDWRPGHTGFDGPHPGRPSPLTAVAFAALGAGMALRDVRATSGAATREALCLTTIFFMFVSLVGHAFGAGPLYELDGSAVMGVALPTGLALSAIAVAALLERPREGLVRMAVSEGPGGVLLRRLGLTALIFGPLTGGAALLLVRAVGLHDLPLILALGNVLAVFLALLLLVATAVRMERTHDASEAHRRRLYELIEQAPAGIFVADLSAGYTEVNDAGCRMLGHTREELLGKTILDLIPPEDEGRLREAQQALMGGGVHTAEWRLRRKDGTFVLAEVTAKILPDGLWQAFVHDISERIELERKVVESRDFLQKVLESSTEYAIIAEDLERRVVLWNEGARRSYGWELDEVAGRDSALLVGPSESAAWQALHARAIERGTAEGNLVARRKDGRTFSASVVCTRMRGAGDDPTGVLVVMRDLTVEQRYLAEQEFLSRVGVELASCLEYGETLTRVAELVSGALGDWVAIDVVADEAVRRVRLLDRRGTEAPPLALEGRSSLQREEGHPLWKVIDTKQPLLLTHLAPDDQTRLGAQIDAARALGRSCASSAMLVPLIARGQLLAVMTVVACDGEPEYGPADLRLALEVARRAALAIDNVQLFQQSRLQGAVTTNLSEGAVLIRASDATIVYANRRFEDIFGYQRGELVGKPIQALNAEDDDVTPVARAGQIIDALARMGAWHGEIKNVRKDGTEFWSTASVSKFDHEEYGPVWIAVHSDITERRLLEEKNARALRDKEVLLREIHHRVKNNLQVISSLFSLQRERTQSAELKALLDESRTRVESIALVHEQLYRSAELAAIDFDEYLRRLLHAIRSSYGAELVDLEVSAKDVVLDVEEAVPCALIVCELVSNSLKHAFDGGRGKVRVAARRDERGQCVLEVSDDGRGIPPEFEWKRARSLGLRLVQGLARQLRGVVELDRGGGTRFSVTFMLRGARQGPESRGASSGAPTSV